MGNVLEKVTNQSIGDVPMETALAELIEKADKAEVEKERFEMQIAAYKQLNNRHKNIIDAQRVEIKRMEADKHIWRVNGADYIR